MNKTFQYKICSVDGSRLYKSGQKDYAYRFSLLNPRDGRPDLKNFDTTFDDSLDIRYLRDVVYPRHSKELGGKHLFFGKDKDKDNTAAIINVTFEHPLKKFEYLGDGLYCDVKKCVDRKQLVDHVYLDDEGNLVAIEVINHGARSKKKYAPVVIPHKDKDVLGEHFAYDEEKKAYVVKKKIDASGKEIKESTIGSSTSTKEIRKDLYKDGFDIDGVHYVRYKRSAGSGRDGSCLFIAEPLHEDMMAWSSCGLDGDAIKDQASWQAYISLTLSSIENTVGIPKKAIMLIPDLKAEGGEEEVVCITRGEEKDGKTGSLVGERKKVSYRNKLWDGEALLDESIFAAYEEKIKDDAKHGMMLLRNRMFKTCAFRTRLQQYFKDNGIEDLSKLGGYAPYAESVEDIKLVVTPSSIKYIKLSTGLFDGLSEEESFKRWLDVIYGKKTVAEFGVVKQDEASGPMNAKCVYTNYQLINTLHLNREQIEGGVLKNSLELLHRMQEDPMYLRYQSELLARCENAHGDDDYEVTDDELDVQSNYRYQLVRELMCRHDDACRLPVCVDYRTDLLSQYKERLKKGRIVVEGNYATLFGNPLEFLRRTVDSAYSADAPLALRDGEIYTRRFADGETLLCARSPHITMGNVFVAKNKHVAEIDKFFCLGDANTIVCVNAVKSHLQQRLNGCDYDSDTMLVTNDPHLLVGAKPLPVPYCGLSESDPSGEKKKPRRQPLDELDLAIANNKVGEIVNLSQFLNSYYWELAAAGASHETLEEIYFDICKLAVLSGIEIDRAKRDLRVSAIAVLDGIRKARKDEYREKQNGLPEFYVFITEGNRKKISKTATLRAPLSHVFDAVRDDDGRAETLHPIEYLAFFELPVPAQYNQTAMRRVESFFAVVDKVEAEIKHQNILRKKSRSRKSARHREETIKSLLETKKTEVAKYLKGNDEYFYALSQLDDEKGKRHLVALYLLCFANDGALFGKIRRREAPMKNLVQDDSLSPDGESIMIYGHPHRVEEVW